MPGEDVDADLRGAEERVDARIEKIKPSLPVVHQVRPFSRTSGEWNSVYDTQEEASRTISATPLPGFATTPEPFAPPQFLSTGDPELDAMLRKLDEPEPEPEPEGPEHDVLRIREARVVDRDQARAKYGARVGNQKMKRVQYKEMLKQRQLEALEDRRARTLAGVRPEDDEGAQLLAIRRQLLRDTAPVPKELRSKNSRAHGTQPRSTEYTSGLGLTRRSPQKLSPLRGGWQSQVASSPLTGAGKRASGGQRRGALQLGSVSLDRGRGQRGLTGRATLSPTPGLEGMVGAVRSKNHVTGVNGTVNRGLYL